MISILTYNVAMLPYFSQNIPSRIKLLAEWIDCFDIVVLQEMMFVHELISSVNFHHYHYFQHGIGAPFSKTGTGILVLSKHPLLEVAYKQYSINGKPHKFYHADYYGAKGVGFCCIGVSGLGTINLYVTHAHANYSDNWTAIRKSKIDEYRAHRVAQMFELGQFVRLTQKQNAVNIICGDLNSDESSQFQTLASPNVSILQTLTGLQDTLFQNKSIATFDEYETKHPAQRLDYILTNKMNLVESGLYNIPNLSDHTGVYAKIDLSQQACDSQNNPIDPHILYGFVDEMVAGLNQAKQSMVRFLILGIWIFLFLLLFISNKILLIIGGGVAAISFCLSYFHARAQAQAFKELIEQAYHLMPS